MINITNFSEADKVCKEWGVECNFAFLGNGSCSDGFDREIWMDLDEFITKREFYSTMCHELAHIWCFDNDKYIDYHHYICDGDYVLKYGLKIERYVDKIAADIFADYFPKMKYKPCYESKEDVEWFYKWVEKAYGEKK